MFIAIVGTRYSGKSTTEEYFVLQRGFIPIRLLYKEIDSECSSSSNDDSSDAERSLTITEARHRGPGVRPSLRNTGNHRVSFLSMGSSMASPQITLREKRSTSSSLYTPSYFTTVVDLLDYVTKNWSKNFVTVDLNTRQLVEYFVRRPFFMLIKIDAPILVRFARSNVSGLTLEEFVQENDILVHDKPRSDNSDLEHSRKQNSLESLSDFVNVTVINSFETVGAFYVYLSALDLLNPEHLRPSWDTYFMTLACLASKRSNCMKRRVGAILVRENRVVSTGYNGTPRGLLNCNEGGCDHCNGTVQKNSSPSECVCLHAEENALLEAGRERAGVGGALYCNTCPCLRCTVKIIQTGVKEVIYNLSYKVDDASARLFNEAGVVLRRHDPKKLSNASVIPL